MSEVYYRAFCEAATKYLTKEQLQQVEQEARDAEEDWKQGEREERDQGRSVGKD